VLGIDNVSHSGMTITTWIQTAPSQQWAVGREFRLRVRRALAAHGIDIGTPRQTYRLESPEAMGYRNGWKTRRHRTVTTPQFGLS
jgi:small-conductance mechanosensitive channel